MNYIVTEREFAGMGAYNPYRHASQKRYGPWKTIAKVATREEAAAIRGARNRGLFHRKVNLGRRTVIDTDGTHLCEFCPSYRSAQLLHTPEEIKSGRCHLCTTGYNDKGKL